jgi:predicted anti-sigma-YlaC factor YlaD
MIAAYLDGDLDAGAQVGIEEHLRACGFCRAELQAQQLFISELEQALIEPSKIPVPQDFARVVAVHAESDMRGARDRAEGKRALRFCLALALASFAFLGVAASKTLLQSGQLMASKILGIVGLFWMTLRDAAVGLIVITRVISGGLLPDSYAAALAGFCLLVLTIGLLSLLISSYHRYRRMRVLE